MSDVSSIWKLSKASCLCLILSHPNPKCLASSRVLLDTRFGKCPSWKNFLNFYHWKYAVKLSFKDCFKNYIELTRHKIYFTVSVTYDIFQWNQLDNCLQMRSQRFWAGKKCYYSFGWLIQINFCWEQYVTFYTIWTIILSCSYKHARFYGSFNKPLYSDERHSAVLNSCSESICTKCLHLVE